MVHSCGWWSPIFGRIEIMNDENLQLIFLIKHTDQIIICLGSTKKLKDLNSQVYLKGMKKDTTFSYLDV